jgi:hypothetical protein
MDIDAIVKEENTTSVNTTTNHRIERQSALQSTWMLRQPECSDNCHFSQLSCCHRVNLCHFFLNGDYLQWKKCDGQNDWARRELPETTLKVVQKVRTGRVNWFLRVHCAAPSFAYYSRGVSSKPFIGLFWWSWKAQNQRSFMCLYRPTSA